MPASDEGLTTTVYTVPPDASIEETASVMVSRGVGDVIVVRGDIPIGIVTDRDLVVRVLGAGLDVKKVSVGEVMSLPLVTVTRNEDISTALALMKFHGIRRLPIMDGDGRLVSILTLDDIQLLGLSEQPELAGILRQQLRPQESLGDPSPATDRPVEQRATPMKIAPQSTGNVSLSAPVATIARPSVVVQVLRPHPPHHRPRRPRLHAVGDWFDRHLFWFVFLLLLTLGVATVYFLTS